LQITRHPPGSPCPPAGAGPGRPGPRRGSSPASGAACGGDALLARDTRQRAAALEVSPQHLPSGKSLLPGCARVRAASPAGASSPGPPAANAT
jgi:hypothetical protein